MSVPVRACRMRNARGSSKKRDNTRSMSKAWRMYSATALCARMHSRDVRRRLFADRQEKRATAASFASRMSTRVGYNITVSRQAQSSGSSASHRFHHKDSLRFSGGVKGGGLARGVKW